MRRWRLGWNPRSEYNHDWRRDGWEGYLTGSSALSGLYQLCDGDTVQRISGKIISLNKLLPAMKENRNTILHMISSHSLFPSIRNMSLLRQEDNRRTCVLCGNNMISCGYWNCTPACIGCGQWTETCSCVVDVEAIKIQRIEFPDGCSLGIVPIPSTDIEVRCTGHRDNHCFERNETGTREAFGFVLFNGASQISEFLRCRTHYRPVNDHAIPESFVSQEGGGRVAE